MGVSPFAKVLVFIFALNPDTPALYAFTQPFLRDRIQNLATNKPLFLTAGSPDPSAPRSPGLTPAGASHPLCLLEFSPVLRCAIGVYVQACRRPRSLRGRRPQSVPRH